MATTTLPLVPRCAGCGGGHFPVSRRRQSPRVLAVCGTVVENKCVQSFDKVYERREWQIEAGGLSSNSATRLVLGGSSIASNHQPPDHRLLHSEISHYPVVWVKFFLSSHSVT